MKRKWLLVLVGTFLLFLCLAFDLVMKWNEAHAQSKTEIIGLEDVKVVVAGGTQLTEKVIQPKEGSQTIISRQDEPTAQWKLQKAFEGQIMAKDSIIPAQTRVENVVFLDGDLLIDFTDEFFGYGGNTYEEALVDLILDTGFGFPDVKSITVFIDGQLQNFVEGSQINRYTREEWEERKVNDGQNN